MTGSLFESQLNLFWHRNYVQDGLCAICGNSGIMPTLGHLHCICPTGLVLRKAAGTPSAAVVALQIPGGAAQANGARSLGQLSEPGPDPDSPQRYLQELMNGDS